MRSIFRWQSRHLRLSKLNQVLQIHLATGLSDIQSIATTLLLDVVSFLSALHI